MLLFSMNTFVCTLALLYTSATATVNDNVALTPEDQAFWGRFLRRSGDSMSVPSPPTTTPCQNSCNDYNACTIDTCTPPGVCTNVPKECGRDLSCDVMDGLCKTVDALLPCMAVIDESSLPPARIDQLWKSFRTVFPDRRFCLLIPNATSARFYLPTDPDFLTDPRAVVKNVRRDGGNAALASDYLHECGYTNLASTGVKVIGVFVDESGSMTRRTVEASLRKLVRGLRANRISYCTVFNGIEDWITPFNTTLVDDGSCNDSNNATFYPVEPEFPTMAPN